MAFVVNNPFGQMRGSLGAQVFQRSASGKDVVRKKVTPINPKTTAQRMARTNFGAAATAFKTLSSANQLLWQSYAASVGVKQGRWEYIKRSKWLNTANSIVATAGTGLTPTTQPVYDPVALLASPNSLTPDYTVTSGTAAGVAVNFTNVAYTASSGTIAFKIALADSTKNMLSLVNAAGHKLGVIVEFSVKKGQSKYAQSFVAISEITVVTAAAFFSLTGLKNSIPRANYKYNPIAGDTMVVSFYMVDPQANFAKTLMSQTSIIVS
jgi:hypothetical protein